ncbi:hypothetical protein [Azospirillum sp. SYSU D00513]|uniref:hypothetical protein n=1 Tax=Azospirillum sp. SYSU D00513 TaxID=2812561 RepID=UPI001A95B01D|nr:hypothetical protein [Azospirillum sp. SYSU D00513]
MPALKLKITQTAGFRHITLGKVRLLEVCREFERIDPTGKIQKVIIETINANPEIAEAIMAATFAEEGQLEAAQ